MFLPCRNKGACQLSCFLNFRKKLIPHPGRAWFDFNDSRVQPIYDKELEKQFAGKESAYMLFYRKQSLVRPNKGECERFINQCSARVAQW